MTWFFLSMCGPFLYAITNHIDKILLEKYFKEGGVGTLILFSSFLSIFAIPLIYLGDPTVLEVSKFNIFFMLIVSIMNIGVLWFYLLALKNDEASVTIVFYQIVPVVGLVLGYVFLDEVLSQLQLIAMFIIMLGTSIVAFEIDSDNNYKLRKTTILYMTIASTLWAMEATLFKIVALEENVWRTIFWEHVTLVIVGVVIFASIPMYRKHFLSAVRSHSNRILTLNFANEAIYMLGNILVSFAIVLAPIALILLAESFQPIFVLAIGVFLTIFFPNVSSEKIEAKHMWQKLFAILVTGVGTYILLFVA